jgi:hypothetical protein
MGYYIYVDLEVKSKKEKEIIADFRNTNETARHALDENGGRNDEVSWTNFDIDLAKFSKKYPKVLFTMRGEGSGVMDIWIHYARNGKYYAEMAEIVYPKFNSKKLK